MFSFLNINMFNFFWIILPVVLLVLYGSKKKRKAFYNFTGISKNINKSDITGIVFLILALVFMIISLARPVANEKTIKINQKSRDTIFVLDVSKSMLAEDIAPNRLERSKLAIKDALEKISTNRVALVAFAGTSVLKCPLTFDHIFFKTALDNLSVNDISRGGSLIGDALRLVMDSVLDEFYSNADIIFISDGEDQDSFPIEAAEVLGEKGVRLIAIGIGDEQSGSRIPLRTENNELSYAMYNNQEVWTKLHPEIIREMTTKTPGGVYINAGTSNFDLGAIYSKLLIFSEKKESGEREIKQYDEKYTLFLFIAFIFLLFEFILMERKIGK